MRRIHEVSTLIKLVVWLLVDGFIHREDNYQACWQGGTAEGERG